MTIPFIHLRLHTEYSLLDSVIRIEDLLEQAKILNMPALGISDFNNFFAVIKFYQEALKKGIKPIVGIDLAIAEDTNPSQVTQLTLFAKNNEGFRALCELISRAYIEGQDLNQVKIRNSWLTEENCQHLIALENYQSLLADLLIKNSWPLSQHLSWMNARFPNSWYIEISRTGKNSERLFEESVLIFAATHHIPLVATNDVRFLNEDEFEAHETRVAIAEGALLSDRNRKARYTSKQYLIDSANMQKLFADLPTALQNSVEIAKRCNVTIQLGQNFLPKYPTGELAIEDYLIQQANQGLQQRLAQQADKITDPSIYWDRLNTELKVITQMGFSGYFLIVADFIAWSKNNNIPVGPGRGSGAGSLVAYALNITDLDPLPYDLLFERFLNPERISMPDFDIDFCMDGRDRVIEYVAEKYGRDNVAQIITYGSMAAKAVVRDVGRVLGHPYPFVDKIAKLIPFELGITLEKALTIEPQLKSRYESEEEVKTLLDLALRLEGLVRNAGKHAGGVVIAPSKLTDFTPLYCESNGESLVSQFDKDDVEAVGLVKFDFLGLRTLTIIQNAINNIKKARGLTIHMAEIPLNDPSTYDTLKRGDTTAIFQLESRGMKDLIKRLRPDCFEDIIALVALFRPGPLQSGMVDDFIQRKHGQAEINYMHPALEGVLKPTYGIILYQEQVMQIAQVLAGYTLGAADLLRRAMGKKKAEEMENQRAIFCAGAKENGIDEKLASSIFDLMEKFAGYGFNKSHSAAYALLSYQTAWLKTHYPAEFMAAVLSSDMDNTDKVVNFIYECQLMKLTIVPPDINRCDFPFTVIYENRDDFNQPQILYGLGAIKGAGEAALFGVLEEKSQHGIYKNLFDFFDRNDLRKLNKKVVEALIKSGALDSFGKNRATLWASMDIANKHAEQKAAIKANKQGDLLGMHLDTNERTPDYVEQPDWPLIQKLQAEKEILGWYISGHPLTAYADEVRIFKTQKVGSLAPTRDKMTGIIAQLTNLRIILTKRGDRMGIVTLEDETGTIDGTLFSEELEKFRAQLQEGNILFVEAFVEADQFTQGLRLSIKRVCLLAEMRQSSGQALLIHVLTKNAHILSSENFKTLLKQSPGNFPILLRHQNQHGTIDTKLGTQWHIQPTDELMQNLRHLFSDEQVEILY